MQYLDDWLSRKLVRRLISIREPRTSLFKHTRPLGPRGEYAVVQLRGEPAKGFAFESHATWPDGCDYSTAILDGILDELFASGLGQIVANVRFTLEAIEWHDVDSCATAFYYAVRGAVREILGLAQYPGNVEWKF